MSDTPETDHLENSLGPAAEQSHPTLWLHARRLERERDEAREELRTALQDRHDFHWALKDAARERDEARDCGQEGVCANPPGCQRHWLERNRELVRERDEARALAEQMSESNAVLMADVRFYRQAWEQLKKAAK
jgi:hypothetical protein